MMMSRYMIGRRYAYEEIIKDGEKEDNGNKVWSGEEDGDHE